MVFCQRIICTCFLESFYGNKSVLSKTFRCKNRERASNKNNVNIKFPWKLTLGNDVWLGENAWIDNLDEVIIGNNVCISQGALLLTGNHDYTLSTFDYRNAPIIIEDGAWIGAKTVVCPGIKVKSHAILTVGSTATKNMEAYGIYQGNPALKIRTRNITR